MKVDFSTQLVNIEGEPMEEPKFDPSTGEPVMEGEGENAKPVMLKVSLARVAKRVLLTTFEDEKNLDADEKLKRWNLAQKINRGSKSVSTEEVSLLKKLIAKAFSPAILGPAFTILEGEEEVAAE